MTFTSFRFFVELYLLVSSIFKSFLPILISNSEVITFLTLSGRMAQTFGHVHVLQSRQRYARDVFQKSYTELFRSESKLAHCLSRVDRGSEYFCESFVAGVSGLEVSFFFFS